VGPDLTGFEQDMTEYLGVRHAVALASGTAAIHLALRYLGVQAGDAVLVPAVTFAATAFPVTYLGATPVFVDIDESWNMDPDLLRHAIHVIRRQGIRVAAALPVDLYGSPANYEAIGAALAEEEIPYVEDAAEALGARSDAGRIGAFGSAGVLSFNGNKIITTSGGGMLVTDDAQIAEKVRHWSTQSREQHPWYEHEEVGFNYRLSNVLAALGRSQLRRIDAEVAARRAIRAKYAERLCEIPGLSIQQDPSWGTSNAWLTVANFDPALHGDAPTRIRLALEAHNIESRPIWKPMHQQPIFADCPTFLTGAADRLFSEGLCLPSGSALDEADVDRVSDLVIDALLR
jgi:pyridoxal phosphate-dependent aminotransferase EpsN